MKLASALSALFSVLVLLLTAHSAAAAPSGMTLAQACRLDGLVDVGFRWKGATTAASAQYLDVSFSDNGWTRGTFSSVGPMGPSVASISAGGFIQKQTYFARVNQLMSDGSWQTSPTYQFSVVDCSDPANWQTASSSSSSSSSTTSTPKTGPKPQPDPLYIPPTGDTSSTPTPAPSSSTSSTTTDDGSSTLCADGATVYGGGTLACSNHGGIAH